MRRIVCVCVVVTLHVVLIHVHDHSYAHTNAHRHTSTNHYKQIVIIIPYDTHTATTRWMTRQRRCLMMMAGSILVTLVSSHPWELSKLLTARKTSSSFPRVRVCVFGGGCVVYGCVGCMGCMCGVYVWGVYGCVDVLRCVVCVVCVCVVFSCQQQCVHGD